MIYPDQPPICDDCLQWKDDRHVCPAINGCGCCGRATSNDWWCYDCARHVLPNGPPHESTWYAQHGERCPLAVQYQYEDQLPANMTDEAYSEWFKQSWIQDGVRVGPPLWKDAAPQ